MPKGKQNRNKRKNPTSPTAIIAKAQMWEEDYNKKMNNNLGNRRQILKHMGFKV